MSAMVPRPSYVTGGSHKVRFASKAWPSLLLINCFRPAFPSELERKLLTAPVLRSVDWRSGVVKPAVAPPLDAVHRALYLLQVYSRVVAFWPCRATRSFPVPVGAVASI